MRTAGLEEGIKHFKITTGLPRANGQVERVNATIIPVLAKLSIDDPTKWYKHVSRVQQILNSSYHRSINMTPFELLVGVKMKSKEDIKVKEVLEAEMQSSFVDSRSELRDIAKQQIVRIQKENKKTYDLRRRQPRKYNGGDLVAIKRTQHGPGLKLKPKFLGPYRVTRVKGSDTYDVQKSGYHEGPVITSSCAEYMKPWVDHQSSGSDDEQDGRDVGSVAATPHRERSVDTPPSPEESGERREVSSRRPAVA